MATHNEPRGATLRSGREPQLIDYPQDTSHTVADVSYSGIQLEPSVERNMDDVPTYGHEDRGDGLYPNYADEPDPPHLQFIEGTD